MHRITRRPTVPAGGGTLARAPMHVWRRRTEGVAAYQSCIAGLTAGAGEG